MIADAVPVDMLHAWRCWAELDFDGSAVRYVWAGGDTVSVVVGGRHRAGLDASGFATVGDMVRAAVRDWETWGGRVQVLPRTSRGCRLRLVWPSAHVVDLETVPA